MATLKTLHAQSHEDLCDLFNSWVVGQEVIARREMDAVFEIEFLEFSPHLKGGELVGWFCFCFYSIKIYN